MNDQDRVELLAEILRERLPTLHHILDEWSVPGGEALTYAQAKDLIWQLLAPLGLTMLGFGAAERSMQESVDSDLLEARALFAQVGEDVGELLDRLLQSANAVRP